MDQFFEQMFAMPAGSEALPWPDIGMCMLLSFVLAQVVAWVYSGTHDGLSYSRSQVHSLILIAVIVTAVMLAIGSNVARAFGLFGALALIRFRTPVKDVRDTVFLFMAVAIGITLGTRNTMLALIGTAAFALIAVYLHWSRAGRKQSNDAVLRFVMPAEGEQEGLLRRILAHYCHTFALVHLRASGRDTEMEFAYQVRLFDPHQGTGLLTDLRAIPGINGVNLLVQNEDEEL